MASDSTATYPIDAFNRVKRRQDRGFYDHATVHELLDAAAMCHVSYVIDGQPFCTPTLFWREEAGCIGMAATLAIAALSPPRVP